MIYGITQNGGIFPMKVQNLRQNQNIRLKIMTFINGICEYTPMTETFGFYSDTQAGAKKLTKNTFVKDVMEHFDVEHDDDLFVGAVVFVGRVNGMDCGVPDEFNYIFESEVEFESIQI